MQPLDGRLPCSDVGLFDLDFVFQVIISQPCHNLLGFDLIPLVHVDLRQATVDFGADSGLDVRFQRARAHHFRDNLAVRNRMRFHRNGSEFEPPDRGSEKR